MIELEFPHRTYSVKSEVSELTISEYESITDIISDESKANFDKYIELLVYLGVEEDDVDLMSTKSVVEFSKRFHESETNLEIKPNFEIEGYKYVGILDENGKPVVTPRITKFVEKIMKSRHKGYISEIAAVILKREDLSNTEHYEQAHIKHKAKLFRDNLMAQDIVPYIIYVTEGIIESVKDIVDGAAE